MKKVIKSKKIIAIVGVAVLAVALLASGVVASPPMDAGGPAVESTINYQGQLTDSSGNPLNGSFSMTFKLYGASSGGSALSTDTHTVQVTDGLFSTNITFSQSYFDGRALWLGIAVGSDLEMTPRQQLRPVPYALSLRPGAIISDASSSVQVNRVKTVTVPPFTQTWKYGVYATSEGTETNNCGVYGFGDEYGVYGDSTNGYAGYFQGNVHITKDLTAGAANVSLPIAYAFIYSNGTVASGTPNVSSSWSAGDKRYEITIVGENYYYTDYVTVVTPWNAPRIATTGSVSGNLLVYIFDTAGNKVQGNFQFVTYKP